MKRQFKYPKHFEEQKKIPKLTQKRIQLAEISLGDFEGRLANELLNWFSLTPQHWIMLHMVMLAYYKNKSITKHCERHSELEDINKKRSYHNQEQNTVYRVTKHKNKAS